MLIRFKVSNFLSFNEEQEFSMIAGKVRNHPKHLDKGKNLNLLKFTAVYGANASGKSNLVTAMDFARTLIVHKMPMDIINSYCRINDENKEKTSKFEFEIKLDDKVYAYGFEIIVNKSSIIEEWLYELTPKNGEKMIFLRKPKESQIKFADFFKEKVTKILDTYAGGFKTNDSVLFLTEMNRNKDDLYDNEKSLLPFKDVYNWFKNKFVINYPDRSISPTYFTNAEKLQKVNEIISDMGLGVNRVEIADGEIDELQKHIPQVAINEMSNRLKDNALKFKNNLKDAEMGVLIRGEKEFFIINYYPETGDLKLKKLLFEHKKNKVKFEISEESDGTRRLLDLIEIIISAKTGAKKVYVIDEINRCLHPQVTYRFISEFLNTEEKNNVQLIVTTHESHIMDLNLLRRDEIWFINKNEDGESKLYSLDQYNARFDKKIRRAYLDGRYGGVPLFDAYYPMSPEAE